MVVEVLPPCKRLLVKVGGLNPDFRAADALPVADELDHAYVEHKVLQLAQVVLPVEGGVGRMVRDADGGGEADLLIHLKIKLQLEAVLPLLPMVCAVGESWMRLPQAFKILIGHFV